MTSFKLLGATLALSALLATPASAYEFDLGARRGLSPEPDLLRLFERWPRIFACDGFAGTARRRVGNAYVGTAASRKSHRRRQALLNTDFESPAFLHIGDLITSDEVILGRLMVLWASVNEPRGPIFQFTVPAQADSAS